MSWVQWRPGRVTEMGDQIRSGVTPPGYELPSSFTVTHDMYERAIKAGIIHKADDVSIYDDERPVTRPRTEYCYNDLYLLRIWYWDTHGVDDLRVITTVRDFYRMSVENRSTISITTEDGNTMNAPFNILEYMRFRIVFDMEKKFVLKRREKDGALTRDMTFTDFEISGHGNALIVTDEDLDRVAFPYHILSLGYYHKMTLKKEPGETFSHREVLDALLELEENERVDIPRFNENSFYALYYEPAHGMYVPSWEHRD